MLKRFDDAERLIALLSQFPGLSQRALLTLHDIAPSLIYRCVEQGLIDVKEHIVGHRSGHIRVFRFYPAKQGASK
jgi:hypothetical protein